MRKLLYSWTRVLILLRRLYKRARDSKQTFIMFELVLVLNKYEFAGYIIGVKQLQKTTITLG